jgi:glycosyltransferase involved in cell wall biosynthesis
MPRCVLVVTEDRVGEILGGAAIRAYEIARALTTTADVMLAAPGTDPPGLAPARHVPLDLGDPRPLRRLFREADVVITRPTSPLVAGWLRASKARIVYDLADPLPLSVLEAQATSSRERQLLWTTLALDHLLEALYTGHHFICSGRRQRDLYLGALLASRLISPAAYKADPSFRSFIERVPFGIPSDAPRRIEGAGPKARLPGIGDDAQIVLWNGGIWNWLDPVTAVAAVVKAADRNPRVRLVFMFTGGVLDGGPETRQARAAYELAQRLGALDHLVFFNDSLVSYAERATWLMDADCVISTHLDHLEANFSFRTRLLDCLWAGVPAVCTRGDELSELLESCGGGVSVPYGDVDAVANGIVDVLGRGRESYRERLLATGADLVWPTVVEPLRRIVQLPGPPRALGDPWARQLSRPLQRGRAAAVRAARLISGPVAAPSPPTARSSAPTRPR